MLVSVITATYNSAATVERCVQSVLSQRDVEIDYVIVDGASSDTTLEVVEPYRGDVATMLSERDSGVYDALNKGIARAKGNIIGFLHADDVFADEKVLSRVAAVFTDERIDGCYGDLEYTKPHDANRVLRYWKSSPYKPMAFYRGWMPPHPTLYLRKEVYEKVGTFRTDMQIAADYEFMLRSFLVHKIRTNYLPEVLVRMSWGGISNRSLTNIMLKMREDLQAWRLNNLWGGTTAICAKNLVKLPQFFRRMSKHVP